MDDTTTNLADRLAITELVAKLFVYTDQGRWDDLVNDVFTGDVHFDGGFGDGASTVTSRSIADGWKTGLADLDAVHHQSGNYIVDVDGDAAQVHADAIAVHAKESATQGKTRTFIGSYAIGVQRTEQGWRIDKFVYHLKIVDGNADLT